MDERIMQFRVGVMFLATLLIAAILLIMFGKMPTLMGQYYTIYVRFSNAGGVTKGTPVRKSGILIGRVKDVQLSEEDSKVLITAEIYSDKKIYKNEDCFISRDYLMMGDTALAFVTIPGKKGAGELVAPGAQLVGNVSDDPTGLKTALQSPINTVEDTGRALRDAADALQAAAKKVDNILDVERENIHDVLANTADALKAIKDVLGDDDTRAKLSAAMKRLPDTLDNMNRTFDIAGNSLQQFSQRSGPDNKTAIERMVATIEMSERMIRKFSDARPGEVAPSDQIANAMSNINEITQLIKTVVGRIENGDGTLGAMMKDRELYDRVCRSARNIEEITQKLKPVIDDARVISDKMARHPGVIIRDAVKPGSGIK